MTIDHHIWFYVPLLRPSSPLFHQGVRFGKELIYLQTFGERLSSECSHLPRKGKAKPILSTPKDYPQDFGFDEKRNIIYIKNKNVTNKNTHLIDFIENVSQEVWEFSISGFKPVQSWLQYRKKNGAGKRSSPLDDIRPTIWTNQMTKQISNILWTIEISLQQYKNMESWFQHIVHSKLITNPNLDQ